MHLLTGITDKMLSRSVIQLPDTAHRSHVRQNFHHPSDFEKSISKRHLIIGFRLHFFTQQSFKVSNTFLFRGTPDSSRLSRATTVYNVERKRERERGEKLVFNLVFGIKGGSLSLRNDGWRRSERSTSIGRPSPEAHRSFVCVMYKNASRT